MNLKPRARMLFRIGLTVIVVVAVYMYYAINREEIKDTSEGTKGVIADGEGRDNVQLGRDDDVMEDNVDVQQSDDNTGKQSNIDTENEERFVSLVLV